MGMFTGIDISASGLRAESLRVQVIDNNVANAFSLSEDGARLHPYRRRTPVFRTGSPADTGSEQLGVSFVGVRYGQGFVAKPSAYPESDPNAVTAEDAQRDPALAPYIGCNLYPDIDLAKEMVDGIEAQRSYEANLTTLQLSRSLIQSTLQVLA
jgi:flagellar basal-body rod protein FlgC